MSGPVILLKAVNYSGSGTWNDESGNGKNATKEVGTIAKNADGNGIVLNGSTSWTFPDVNVGDAWTANVWYKNTGPEVGAPATILTQIYNPPFINLSIGNNDTFYITTRQINCGFLNSDQWRIGNTIQLVDGKWINIQVTWDGTNLITYVNSKAIGSAQPGVTSVTSGLAYRIGRRWDQAYFMTGEIGEVRIYNYALNATQVRADYIESIATFSKQVILLKAINYSGSGTWNDESGNGNDATKVYGTIAKNAAGNGIVLDGSTDWRFPNVSLDNAWSVNVWFRVADPSVTGQILWQTQAYPGSVFNVWVGYSGYPASVAFYTAETWNTGTDFNSYMQSNIWINVQATWDGINLSTYINNTLIGITQPIRFVGPATSEDSGVVYQIGNGLYGYTTGEIGEVRMYNYAINQAKVTADYNSSYGIYYSAPRIFIRPRTEYTAIQVWWRDPLSSGGYNVANYIISCLDQTFSPVTLAYPATDFYITGLTSLTPYTFQIVAVNTNGNISVEAVFRTVQTDIRPAKPATASATTMYVDGSVVISWTPTINTTSVGYAVILEPIGGGPLVKASAYSDASSLYVTGLTPTSSYNCNVYTVNDAGWSEPTATDTILNAI